jgi:uncharacterized protein (TIGR02246 family)
MSEPAVVVQRFIDSFIEAWPRADVAQVAAFFTEDAIYHNVPMEPAVGREAIEATFAQFMAMGGQVDVELLNILSSDTLVMTERVDYFVALPGSQWVITCPEGAVDGKMPHARYRALPAGVGSRVPVGGGPGRTVH